MYLALTKAASMSGDCYVTKLAFLRVFKVGMV